MMKSFTIWFENGAWLKTNCYEDRWQEFSQLLDVQTNPVEISSYPDLFEAIAAVEPFNEESPVFFGEGFVASHREADAGAVYEVKNLPAGKIFDAKLIRQVSPYVLHIDLTTQPDRGFFFGNSVRGVFMGMAGSR
jgi:hypothetical protein